MARGKHVRAECDICGFAYKRTLLRKNSFDLWVCPNDWDGSYDRVNHAQNKTPNLRDNSQYLMNARPDPNIDRNIKWEDATEVYTTIYQWELVDKKWSTV
jgi:hypothetical protein